MTTGQSTIECSTVTVTFADANTVIQSSCAKNSTCQASGSSKDSRALTTYAQIYIARNEISDAIQNGRMPPDGQLSTSEKNTILCWKKMVQEAK